MQDDCKPQILCGMRIESPPASRLYKTPFLSRCRTIPKCAGYIIKIILYFTTLNWYFIHWTADNQEARPMTYDNRTSGTASRSLRTLCIQYPTQMRFIVQYQTVSIGGPGSYNRCKRPPVLRGRLPFVCLYQADINPTFLIFFFHSYKSPETPPDFY